MSNSYDDSKYGVIERHWFGLTKKCGGDAAAGFTDLNVSGATTLDSVVRFHPKGPIKLLKVGSFKLATMAGGGTGADQVPARLMVNGSNESADFDIPIAGAPFTIASTTTFTNDVVDAGSYIGIRTGTPETGDATEANGASVTGTLSFFVDYVRNYSDKWDQ
jgi:hypothetical protein